MSWSTLQELKALLQDDDPLQDILQATMNEWPSNGVMAETMELFSTTRDETVIYEGVLFRVGTMVIPKTWRKRVQDRFTVGTWASETARRKQ